MAGEREHIREIEEVLSGARSVRDDIVVQSWLRCIDTHRLDPARPTEAYIVPDTQLREHREQSERLIAIARSGLETLFKQVAGQNYVLLLADAKGVTVDFLGDPLFMDQLRTAGLYLGSEWSESRTGTCGVGSCIVTGEAMTIHQTDHFDTTHTPLSCTAAPIFDTKGELTAVLDISLLRSPQPKVSQNLALHLVTASARRIELANLMAPMHSEWVLRFSRSPEFLDVDPEAAVALDASGRILGTTRGGALLLAQAGGVDWRLSSPIGHPISRYLDMGIDDLPNLTRGRPTEERLVFGRNGSALFAHAIEPQPSSGRRAPTEALPKPISELSGGDPAMAAMQTRAAKLARTTIPILIHGETGSGKEYLARALHDSSGRSGPFVAINCAAIPEHLIESELFGHAAGAFTGATAKGRKGLIESAEGGSLFLDEIGDMPYALQSRLLRVIAERELIPVGGTAPRSVDIKIISASHHDLRRLVAEGRFREDLFYRLNAASLTLPALRERTDFEWLLERLVGERARLAGRPAKLSPAARLVLIRHDWPGNIRELVNAVDLAVALCDDEMIQPTDLPDFAAARMAPPAPSASLVALRAPSPEEERAALLAVLAGTGWNISEAARRLGVDRTTVHRRMKRLRLEAPN
ncbi:sigma-54-dependent Fis family transcriptional regulator [Mesorhizobium sp.]|uniref:sigma-54-dependent Fis family transcriptional regulator n=1 Tax=Mesorhizobium sp. TaxID=1871066 RepID=UPI000FE4075F|nr:sigma-54-dependent Fis family transcriptional regulator [Mesorhizobium sp.]RWH70853.1 MAG: sigma-54-dependent Fis family transcriptional regulator [Mesorhizobium sp.]RWL27354.1 MAG: sigma-54-dependent Fis family transcriptional regulator [Mesorhizobium sp.]RWL31746.1 MAG: sigma-54-dependent Fis family transcriptional regulator [Mesorhizobium sp.]RWL38570.1 MAG: sigma-54-dependent Fis family transcriptional regulator [Mesorhizobium sp.]RWL54074.1 MAG: sigma-54-dependent Fis family transcript